MKKVLYKTWCRSRSGFIWNSDFYLFIYLDVLMVLFPAGGFGREGVNLIHFNIWLSLFTLDRFWSVFYHFLNPLIYLVLNNHQHIKISRAFFHSEEPGEELNTGSEAALVQTWRLSKLARKMQLLCKPGVFVCLCVSACGSFIYLFILQQPRWHFTSTLLSSRLEASRNSGVKQLSLDYFWAAEEPVATALMRVKAS